MAIYLTVNNLGTGNVHFVAFAPHGFNEDGKVQFSTATDSEIAGGFIFFDTHSKIGLLFLKQTFVDLAGGGKPTFSATKWTGDRSDGDFDSGVFDFDGRQTYRMFWIGNRLTNREFGNT